MQRRNFGDSGLSLSALSFGCMRLDAEQFTLRKALDLVLYLYDHGVTSFHSSHEYDSFVFYCKVMRAFRRTRPSAEIEHISKIGVPHFDEENFSPHRLVELIDTQLKALGTDHIDIVQWLVRHSPNEDAPRLALLEDCREAVAETWAELRIAGKVGILASFPYSPAFADAALRLPSCRGLVTYLNPAELDDAVFLDRLQRDGQGFVAIRPLFGGRVTSRAMFSDAETTTVLSPTFRKLGVAPEDVTHYALRFPLLHPTVASVMVGVSSLAHAEAAIAATAEVAPNKIEFTRALAAFRSARALKQPA
jgi:aryl-alcohol dehydrogenase-like predicted oxidoreductase